MTNKHVYLLSDEIFLSIVTDKTIRNINQCLKKLGMNNRGRAYYAFRKRCEALKVDISHLIERDKSLISDSSILTAIKQSASRQEFLCQLHLDPNKGSNVRWAILSIARLNASTTHWKGQAHMQGKTNDWSAKIPLEKILVENSTYTSNVRLKMRLVKAGLLIPRCNNPACNLTSWLGKKLTLQLDHINGKNNDHRLENLRLLCPNCHSQTDTFCRGARV